MPPSGTGLSSIELPSEEHKSPKSQKKGVLGLLGATAWMALLALGWLSFAAIVGGLLLERFPGAERWVAGVIADRVDGPVAERVQLEELDVLWTERSVALRGLSMGPAEASRDANHSRDLLGQGLSADEIIIRLGWTLRRGLRVERVSVRGGSAVVSEALSRGFDSQGPSGDDGGSTLQLLAQSPEVHIEDFHVALALPDAKRLELGSVDLHMAQLSQEAGAATGITGRFRPLLRAANADSPMTEGASAWQPLPGATAHGTATRLAQGGTVWLTGTLGPDRVARVRGIARDLEVSINPALEIAPVKALERFQPSAKIDIAAEAEYELGRSMLPSVVAKVSISDGAMVLPWLARSEDRPVEGFRLVAEVGFDAGVSDDPFDPAAWRATGRVQAEWEDLQGVAGFRAGTAAPSGAAAEVWVDLPDAPLGERLGELVAGQKDVAEIDAMLDTDGSADVCLGIRIPTVRPLDQPLARSLERVLLIRAKGDASLAYHGGIDRRTKLRNVGFPLPIRRVVGDVTWSIRQGGRFPGQLGLFDLIGFHGNGPVSVQGSQHFTPRSRFRDPSLAELVPTPFHLMVSTKDLPLDHDFAAALKGLYGVPEVAEILPTWNPDGGTLDLELQLWRSVENRDLAMDLETSLQGVAVRWAELPVPMEDAHGTVRVQTDGGGPEHGRALARIDMTASSPVARDPIRVKGRVSTMGAPEGIPQSVAWFDVLSNRLNPRSAHLREEVARKNPEAATALDGAGAAGFVDLQLTAVSPLPGIEAASLRASSETPQPYLGGMQIWGEVRPHEPVSGMTLQPAQFPLVTRKVHGRVLASSKLPPELLTDPDTPDQPWTALVANIQGEWRQVGPSVPIAAHVRSEGQGPARLSAIGAGLDIANRSIVGSLTNMAKTASSGDGGLDPVDTDGFDVAGRVDFAAEFTLPEAPGLPVTDSKVSLEARLDKLGVQGSQILRDVSAHFRFNDATGEWVGEEVDAKLGDTAIELTGLSWRPAGSDKDGRPAAGWDANPGSTLRATLSAKGLPIDAEHLGFFLDPATIRTVLDDLKARGSFDIQGADLRLTDRRDGTRLVELDGSVRVQDAFIDLGAPIEISLIESMELSLAHEGKALRSRATIDGLFGAIAGRRLKNASMQVTYVEPRLVIEALDGGFERGRLRALGSEVAQGADLFSIDLAPPFPFRLAAEMQDVDIGEFLRGVFDSDFANRGVMDLSMRLAGDFEHLIEMKGGGEIRIRDSALWAIPVFQALSQRLGIDTTVLFQEMYCDYSIQEGALGIDRMRVDSDLLSLVGTGLMTFEGEVTSDLEVRYGIVDALGPFTRLLYWIQNSLLRVSIRGTMDRPTVVLRGLVSQLFSPAEERDRLPLPGFSRRPKRF